MPASFFQRSPPVPVATDQERAEANRQSKTDPFLEAANDLASKWDEILDEMNGLRDKAARYRAESAHLSSQFEAVKQEWTDRVAFLAAELKRQTERADNYQNAALKLRVKFGRLAEALISTLKQDFSDMPDSAETAAFRGVPEKSKLPEGSVDKGEIREAAGSSKEAEVQEDVSEIIQLINRLTPGAA
jgi:predicted nuclease with TOPRIM domain